MWNSYWNGLYVYGHKFTFNWLFSEQLTAYLLYFKRHILTRNTYQSALAPCVSVLILPECTAAHIGCPDSAESNSTGHNNLDLLPLSPSVLALILSDRMNSLQILLKPLWANSSKQRYSFFSGIIGGHLVIINHRLLVQHVIYRMTTH